MKTKKLFSPDALVLGLLLFLFPAMLCVPKCKKIHKVHLQTSDYQPVDTSSAENYYRDLYSDTWVATDGLGRKMPLNEEVGNVKSDQRRVVGIFYITWHTQDHHTNFKSPYSADVSKILQTDTGARLDGNHPLWTENSYHWGEPEMGYFLSQDEYVIRKDMSMLTDAGVDVLVMDVTNAVRYWDEWEVIFRTMQKMIIEGNKVPKFCFWAFNGPVINVVQELYDKIYKAGKYENLWFYWHNKPLLLFNGRPGVDANTNELKNPNPRYDPEAKTDKDHPNYGDPMYTEEFLTDYSQEVKLFFTLRTMWWGYYKWYGERFVGTEGNWSFGYDLGNEQVKAMKPDELIAPYKGKKEQAVVTPAQHASSFIGKSWTRAHGEPELNEYDLPIPTFVPWLGETVENPQNYGIYFQNRWDEALQSDPEFIYINDWNEWTAGKYKPYYNLDEHGNTEFMRRTSNFVFIDQYNAEFTRCIQPMKDGYTDNYYMQMVQNIRKYKGVRKIPENSGYSQIDIDGNFQEWKRVKTEYRDTKGDVFHRDHSGYGGLHYTNKSGRNDILTCKVAVDKNSVNFYAKTARPLTPSTDDNWMLLLIDADKNSATGWHGYDYQINKEVVDHHKTVLMRYDTTDQVNTWNKVTQLSYRYSGNELELSVARELLGLSGSSFAFDFKWTDNPADLDDPISFCTHGDTAPNRRFNYRYIWSR